MATAEVVMLNAESEFKSGNLEKAAESYTKALSIVSESGRKGILQLRSKCFFEMQQYPMALQDAEELIRENADDVTGYNIGAECLSKLQRFQEAYQMLKTSLQLDCNNLNTKNGLKNMKLAMLEELQNVDETTNGYETLKMCSQDAYPGDKELLIDERKMLSKWESSGFDSFGIPNGDLNSLKKGSTESSDSGHSQYVAIGNLKTLLKSDPSNISKWTELLNLLFTSNKLWEAWHYSESVPVDIRNSRFWIIGGKIRRDLGLPVMAELWFRNATKCSEEGDMEAATLFQQVRVRRMYEPLTSGSPIEVTFSQYGRAIRAKENIQKSAVLFEDSPVVLSQTEDSKDIVACSHCAKCLSSAEHIFGVQLLKDNQDLKRLVARLWPKSNIVKCSKCDFEVYCGDACREDAWENYHQVICTSVNSTIWKLYDICTKLKSTTKGDNRGLDGLWNASFSPMLLARVWATIICNAAKLAKARGAKSPDREDWIKAKIDFRRFIAYGFGSHAQMVPKMVGIMKEIFRSVPKDLEYEITEKEFDARYYQVACNVQAFSDPDHPLLQFRRKLKTKPIWNKIKTLVNIDPPEAIFAGLFPVHACLNHSCMNNVVVLDGMTHGKSGVHVTAKTPIEPGDELFTTYIDTRLSRRQRRNWLFRAYNFWCKCPRCEFEGDDSSTCTECGKKSESQKGFPVCSKCHRAWYCSTQCQKKAWKKGHKRICCST